MIEKKHVIFSFQEMIEKPHLKHKSASLEFHNYCRRCSSKCSEPSWSWRQICCNPQRCMCSWDDHLGGGGWKGRSLGQSDLPLEVEPEHWDSGPLRKKNMKEIFSSTHVCREAMSLYSRSDRSGILDSARLRSFRRSSQIQSQAPCIGTFGGNQQDFNVDLLNIRIIIHIVSIPVKCFNVCSNAQVNQFRLLT